MRTFVLADPKYAFALGRRIFIRRSPKYVFSFWKTYSSLTLAPPHRFGDIFATVTPNEAILVALVSYRAPIRVGIGCMPWFSVVFCWCGKRGLAPFSRRVFG